MAHSLKLISIIALVSFGQGILMYVLVTKHTWHRRSSCPGFLFRRDSWHHQQLLYALFANIIGSTPFYLKKKKLWEVAQCTGRILSPIAHRISFPTCLSHPRNMHLHCSTVHRLLHFPSRASTIGRIRNSQIFVVVFGIPPREITSPTNSLN
jgi:hypothetical protein